jgi:hypothetical protein
MDATARLENERTTAGSTPVKRGTVLESEKRKASWNAFHERNPGKRAFYAKRWRENNPTAGKRYYQEVGSQLYQKKRAAIYGLTVEQVEHMRKDQNGVCAICFGSSGGKKDLHIDHCHATGKVRGLLCESCNRGLGFFRDSPDHLVAAAKYLAVTLRKTPQG